MSTSTRFLQTVDLTIDDVAVRIAVLGDRSVIRGSEPVLFLHGFGSTKEDYADFNHFPGLTDPVFLAYDAPGFGNSTVSDPTRVGVPFLVEVALGVLDEFGIDRFHLVGHSMGGLTALLLADRIPNRVISFIDIEGNLASEDCFLSRQISFCGDTDPAQFLSEFAARFIRSGEFSAALYGSRVVTTVDPNVVRTVFESMVDLSDNCGLLKKFTASRIPRMFMHGEQNDHLSYLPELRSSGVDVVSIKQSGHWPMYSNPPAMWSAIQSFLATVAQRQ